MKTRKTRRKEWVQRVGFGLYVSLLVGLFVGTIVIAFTQRTGGPVVLAGLLAGIVLWLFAFICGGETHSRFLVAMLLPLLLLVFFSSWVVAPSSGCFAVKINETQIILSEDGFFNVPYTGKIDYVHDITASIVVSLSGDKEYRVEAYLSLMAGHDQALALLEQFGGKEEWMAAVRALFGKVVERYAKGVTDFPRRFSLPLEQVEEFLRLGFVLDGDCLAQEEGG